MKKMVAVVMASVLGLNVFANIGENDGTTKAKADARVKKALDASGVKYTINSHGDFRVFWTLEGGRTHVAFVDSNTSSFGPMEVRDVWAVAHVADEAPSAKVMLELLTLNSAYKVGSWGVHKRRSGKYWIFYKVTVSASSSGAVLELVSNTVAKSADKLERELSGKDDY